MASIATAEHSSHTEQFRKAQTICRASYKNPKAVTLGEVKETIVPLRPSCNKQETVDFHRRNIILLQCATITALARQSKISQHFTEILEKLIEEDAMTLALIDLTLSNDDYISYASTISIVSLLTMSDGTQEPKNWQMVLVQDVVSKLVSTESFKRLDMVFFFTHKLIRHSHNVGMLIHITSTVCASWRFFLEKFRHIIKKHKNKDSLSTAVNEFRNVVTFLRLWKLVIRIKRTTETATDCFEAVDMSQVAVPIEIHDDMYKLAKQLIPILNATKKSYVTQSRALDVLNTILSGYGGTERERKHRCKLGKYVIIAINHGLYEDIDFQRHIKFGSSNDLEKSVQITKGKAIHKYKHLNKFILRKIALLACNAGMETLDATDDYMVRVVEALEKTSALGNHFKDIEKCHSLGLLYWIKDVFNEQDDDWVVVLLALLSITIDQRRAQYVGERGKRAVDIHVLFLDFCKTINYDTTVLLDLLITDDTRFLLLLTKYLKFLIVETQPEDDKDYENKDFNDVNESISPPDTFESAVTPSCHYGDHQIFGQIDKSTPTNVVSIVSDSEMLTSYNVDSSLIFQNTTESGSNLGLQLVPNEEDFKTMMYMFVRFMLLLQKIRKNLGFNVVPLIRLLHKIQKIKPYTLKGYVKLVPSLR